LVTAPTDALLTAGLRAAYAQPLAAAAIARALAHGPAQSIDPQVETALETGSTNSDLLARARAAAPAAPIVRAALAQTAGRGRLGRRWFAAPGSALLFSLALPLADTRAGIGPITLACGVAVAETLRALEVPADLKWPNDLWLAGRKLGGLLCELALDGQSRRTLVIGVGINAWLDAAARASIGQPAAALVESVAPERLLAQREAWIGRIGAALIDAVQEFERDGFLPFQPRFMRRFALVGRAVAVFDRGVRAASGQALGVDLEGRLLISTPHGVRAVASGDVSLRAADE
jgi:BirA family biotin operon repressor/biotin-[acetyl-CoA-carboxylase] ligase